MRLSYYSTLSLESHGKSGLEKNLKKGEKSEEKVLTKEGRSGILIKLFRTERCELQKEI